MSLEDAIARLKANSGYERDTQRGRDIRALVEAVEAVEYEYGTRWFVEGDRAAWMPQDQEDRLIDYAEDSEESARKIIEEDRKAMGLEEPRGILLRRPVFDNPWKEIS
jgi:hypothetical protein